MRNAGQTAPPQSLHATTPVRIATACPSTGSAAAMRLCSGCSTGTRDELQVTAPWWWMSTCATRPATSCRPRTRRGGPGFTSRRVIRRAGQSSNRVRRRRTGIAGNANDEDASAFEPHYTEITAADQVQIYEPIIGDPNGNVTTALLRGVRYLKDNRLLPDGFDKGTVDEAVAVQGVAAADADFTGRGDRVRYPCWLLAPSTRTIRASASGLSVSAD